MSGRMLALLFVATLPLVTVRIYAADELQYYSTLRSLWKDGDLECRDEYEHLLAGRPPDARERRMLLDGRTATGHAPNYVTIGAAVLWLPAFAVGDVVARAGGWPTDGYSYPYRAAVCYASAFLGFLGLWLLFDVARRHTAERVAAGGALVAWWASALPFYLYVTPPMVHATSVFATALVVWLWARGWTSGGARRGFALGAACGLAALVREQNALFVLLPAADVVRGLVTAARAGEGRAAARALRSGAAAAAGVVLALMPQLLAWNALYGRFAPAPERVSFFEPWPRHLAQVLFSANHGLASWHPAWLFGIAGFAMLVRRRPVFFGPLLAVFVAELCFLGSVSNWAGGMAFGQRRLLDCLFILVLGLPAVFERLRPRAALAVGAVLVWWNLSLLVQFGSGMIPREGPVEWGAVVHQQVFEVPLRLGELAGRYLGARQSFFENHG